MLKCNTPLWGIRLALLLFVMSGTVTISAQCDPPDELPTTNCAQAPQTCLNNACYSTDNMSDQGHSGFCGPMTLVHNPQYFAFVAIDTVVQIDILINNCTSGVGLQSAIIDIGNDLADCDNWVNDDVIACDPNFNGSTSMVATGLDSGEVYLLLIDGSNAATCEYTITYAEGMFEPGLNGDIATVNGDATACPGDTTWSVTASPQVGGAHGYLWEFTPGGTFTSTNPTLNVSEDGWDGIPEDWSGIYQVCVTPYSGCDTGMQVCLFSFEVIPVDDGTSPPDTHCLETYQDVGVPWGTLTISSPGDYTQTFFTPEGCPHDSTKTFEAWPVAPDGSVDTVICGESFTYEGQLIDMAGAYDFFYDDASQYGCDSMATVNAEFAFVDASPSFECDLGDFNISANVSQLIPASTSPDYVWTDGFGNTVSTDPDWTTNTPGTYTLEIILTVNGVQCVYPNGGFDWTVDIIPEDLFPDAPVFDFADSVICATELGTYSIESAIPGQINDINWVIPGDAVLVGGFNSEEISIDWQNSAGGDVCVSWTNDCGESDQTCVTVEVITASVPLFNIMSTPACVDEVVFIEFSGTASGSATFSWDFDGGTIVSGGTGPGPHEILWNNTGTKDVKLVLSEPGCTPDSVTLEVMIENIGTPVVNCQSTTTSITFEWSSVTGSTGFMVNVLDGPNGSMINDTTYEVTGLANGQEVTIEVLANGNGVCPPTADTITCSAEDCTAPTWMIIAPDTVCENDAAFNFEAEVNGAPATGTWSGPGITDGTNGTFDPAQAGTGTQTVVFQYDDGTCVFNFQRNIVVLAQPTAAFTMDAAICQLSPATVTYTGTAGAGATYNWNFGGGTILSGTGAGPYSIQWATPGSKTVTLTVEENGCLSDPVSRMIDLDAALASPVLNCNTTTTSITFTWGDVAGASNYTVNVLSGMSGTQGPGNEYTVTGLMPGDMVTIEVIANSSNNCPPTADTLECTAQDCPSPTITIGPIDTSICLYPGLTAFNMTVDVSGGSGSGSGTWSGTGITDAATGRFDPVSAGPGSHVITYDYTDQSCMFSQQTTVFVYDVPTATISNTDFNLTCDNGNELVLDGSQSTAASGTPQYVWTTSDGLIKTGADSAYAIAGRAGTYTLTVVDPVSGCRDSTAVTLQQDANVPTADAGPDAVLDCDVDVMELGGNSSTGPDVTYLWTTTNGRIMSDPTQQTVMVDMAGTYALVVTDTVNGCESADNAVVTQNVTVPTIMLDVDGVLTCDNASVTATADVSGGSGNYAYSWSTVDGTINGPTDGASITTASPGFYQVMVMDNDNGCADSSEVEVFADSDVIASLDDSFNDVTCFGDGDGSVTISSVVGGSEPYSFVWSNGSDGMSLTGLGPGDYSVTVTDDNGCSFEQSWTVSEPPLVTADIGDNLNVSNGDSVTVTLMTSLDPGAVDIIQWTGPFGTCDDCYDVSFVAEESGSIQASVTDTNGCYAEAVIQLTVVSERDVFTPNVFTPDGDGTNDFFNIFGGSVVSIEQLSIHDRWGNLVYSTNNLEPNNKDQGWDGTFKGEVMNPGVYVFYAKVVHDDTFEEELIGDITLIR